MKYLTEILPGLPNDVALECLIRLPFRALPGSCHVSKEWRAEIESPDFRHRRKHSNLTRPVIVLAQSWADPTRKKPGSKNASSPFYRLVMCEPETGEITELPPIPDLPTGLPVLCHLAGVGTELVVIGGCDPVTWRVLDSVFVYSFVTATWRTGARMPGGERLFFGCDSDSVDFESDPMYAGPAQGLGRPLVYVAGGHDENKDALKSVLAYDVAKNEWSRLPDMAIPRDECTGICHAGKFHVIGGYGTESQGNFRRDSEALDFATWQWGPVDENFLKHATCHCVSGLDGNIYACGDGKVMEKNREGATWRVVNGLPMEVRHVDYVTAWQGKLFVIGYEKFDEAHRAFVMDLKSCIWTRIEASQDYLGHVQSGCYLEI